MILGVDGGNSKTELLVATLEGEPVAHVRGPGSNAHTVGREATVAFLGELISRAGLAEQLEHATFYLCGVDIETDRVGLTEGFGQAGWARAVTVDNDIFALLRAGTDDADAVAVVCGAGINCAGRSSDGRIARYPSLGWETGDWGGAEMLGREALSLAARAEDGRGDKTVLVERIRAHFGAATVEAVGVDVHYRRLPQSRLGELAPLVVAAADEGDAVASQLVDCLAGEVALLARKAMRDLELERADVVLGGGMLRGEPVLVDRVRSLLPVDAVPVVLTEPPVTGAVLAALDAAGASSAAKQRVRQELHGG